MKSKVFASIDGDPLFGHKSSPFLAFLAEYSQNYKGTGPFFWPVFFVFLHRRGFVTTRTTYRIQATIRFHSHTLTFLIYSQLPCHHHVTRPGFAFLQRCSPSGSLQNSFTKSLISFSAYYRHSLVWFFGTSAFFGQSNNFFFVFAVALLLLFSLRKPRVERWSLLTFKLVLLFPRLISGHWR
jgi:hypothetical protein